MKNFLGRTRGCATCEWWEGERIADVSALRVHTPRHAGSGFCRSPVSWWVHRLRQAESVCCFWQQWEPVRHLRTGQRQFPLVMLGKPMTDSEYLQPLSAPPPRAASHVLLIEPVNFRYNQETGATNAFQVPPSPEEARQLSAQANEEHRRLRQLLLENGVEVTLARSLETSPDAPFCNNWFSTHPAGGAQSATMVLYPLLAENRRIERRADLVALLRPGYPRLVDLSPNETQDRFLESTGSLVLDHAGRVAYAALSPRTDLSLATEWAGHLGYDLVAFTALDRAGVPFYHTNVLMFVGHGLAGVCLESIASLEERHGVEQRLRRDGNELLRLSQEQAANFCGNCLALSDAAGRPLFVMSSQAWRHFSEAERAVLERHGRMLHCELTAFERLGGGSARCLIAELF